MGGFSRIVEEMPRDLGRVVTDVSGFWDNARQIAVIGDGRPLSPTLLVTTTSVNKVRMFKELVVGR